MTLFFADLVREFSYGAGTGPLPLGGALPGHRRFADAVPAGARFHYCIACITHPAEWETGEGRIEGGLLMRMPQTSSAGGAAVEFAPGLKTVALTATAQWFTEQEQAGGPMGIADVEGLEAALAGKAAAVHDHEGAYQPADAVLSALAALDAEADRLPYFSGAGTAALAAFTAFGRALTGDADAAAARARLGLGTLGTQAAGNVAITGGSIIGVSGVSVGTGDAPRKLTVGASDDSFNGIAVQAIGTNWYIDNRGSVDAPAGRLAFSTGGSDMLTVLPNGNVGIGAAAPDALLDVAGLVRCDSLRIDATPVAETVTCTHSITFSANGTQYKIPCAAA